MRHDQHNQECPTCHADLSRVLAVVLTPADGVRYCSFPCSGAVTGDPVDEYPADPPKPLVEGAIFCKECLSNLLEYGHKPDCSQQSIRVPGKSPTGWVNL